MAIYKDDSRVNRFDVGIYHTTNKMWWTKGKELKTFFLNDVFKVVDFRDTKEFNDLDKISVYMRNPLKSEKTLFNNHKNFKVGKAGNEIDLKRLILNFRFKYDQRQNRS